MAYCKSGEKATVNYSFKGVSKSYVVAANNTPIDVNTYQKRINAGGTFSTGGFTVRFYSPNNRATVAWAVHDYLVYPSPDFDYGVNYEGISPWFCGDFDFLRDADGKPRGTGVDITTIERLSTPTCTAPLTANRCSIEVKSKGIIIFQDQGECPVSFNVICGEDCPSGTLKCPQSGYPGYCCLPCDEIAAGIKAITTHVRSINNG